MENFNWQPWSSQGPSAANIHQYHHVPVGPHQYVFAPIHAPVAPQGFQVIRFRVPGDEDILGPHMAYQFSGPPTAGYPYPFFPVHIQPINQYPAVLQPINPQNQQAGPPQPDIPNLSLDATIALVPGRRHPGHRDNLDLIEHYRRQWLVDYQRVMSQITQLQQSLGLLKTRETCLFVPLNIMMVQQFNELGINHRTDNLPVFQAIYDCVQNRMHNSGATDIVALHAECIKTTLNSMFKFLTPGTAEAPPPPGAGVWVPDNAAALHMPR